MVGKKAAQQRAGYAGQCPYAAKIALIASAFARRDNIADDRKHQGHHAAGTDALQRAEPTRKRTIAPCRIFLRPSWSLILPYSGVATALVIRYAVTTQDNLSSPFRSLAMRGRAVETIVWSSAASSITSISANITTIISRCVRSWW